MIFKKKNNKLFYFFLKKKNSYINNINFNIYKNKIKKAVNRNKIKRIFKNIYQINKKKINFNKKSKLLFIYNIKNILSYNDIFFFLKKKL
ncbi:ribonuclease P protein component [Candidatus Karelsulcia muelleri]|uniref:ribonuclease P protein component n=1 Tax=Candidatus Karelsulcia muelleri TaxID=336810 RepID=UPI0035C8AD55